jgi:ferrochelatase
MSQPFDAILLIAFGAPASADEIRPFLARVTEGLPIGPARLEEVARHYEAVGGKSPLNEITFRQAAALEKSLEQRDIAARVYVGMRNSEPFLARTLSQMQRDGVRRALGFILSSQRCEASWERYQKNVDDARAQLEKPAPEVDYAPGWHDHPLFVQSWAESIGREAAKLEVSQRHSAPLIFTAHSLPAAMAARSPYVEQVENSARLIATKLAHRHWSVAYQSRSGRPGDPWLEPDIAAAIRAETNRGAKEIIVAPIGFVCDHVEVLYDLDIEAAKLARQEGARLVRASCPNDNPTFIAMMADVIQSAMARCAHDG